MQSSIKNFFGKGKETKNQATSEQIEETTQSRKRKRDEEEEGNNIEQQNKVVEEKSEIVENEKEQEQKKQMKKDFSDLGDELELEKNTIHPSWLNYLADEIKKPYFKQLKEELKKAKERKEKVFPPDEDIYSWSRFCPLDQVKVVILGQDPYHGEGQAHGLAFSVRKGVKTPPSLVNIYKELTNDIPSFRTPNHGNLEGWSRQGVLLLNATLTVKQATPNSHAKLGWDKFTDKVIQILNEKKSNLVFILWGAFAQKKAKNLNSTKHLILKGAHPSPFSCTDFYGCKHFSKTNDYLKKHKIQEINWSDFNVD